MVQCAAVAALEVLLVVEDAGPTVNRRFAGAVLLFDPALLLADLDVLPQVALEFFYPAGDPLLILLLGKVRAQGAAARIWGVGVDAFAAAPENAGPARGKPGQVGSINWSASAGSMNSTHWRGKSRATSGTEHTLLGKY